MKAEYDLSKIKPRKNPYAAKLKKTVTMRLSDDVIGYFKKMAEETGMPYQFVFKRLCFSTQEN